MTTSSPQVRPARAADVHAIRALVQPYADERILLAKEWVGYYEALQEFVVAEVPAAEVRAAEVRAAAVQGAAVQAAAVEPAVRGGAPAVTGSQPTVVGCGALHVLWQDLAEIRTLAVDPAWRGRRVGHALLEALVARAYDLGLRRLFCLTFEVDFFVAHGFEPIAGTPVTPEVYAELLRSHDDGVAEFLDLARVKPNTLGNTRMLITLH